MDTADAIAKAKRLKILDKQWQSLYSHIFIQFLKWGLDMLEVLKLVKVAIKEEPMMSTAP